MPKVLPTGRVGLAVPWKTHLKVVQRLSELPGGVSEVALRMAPDLKRANLRWPWTIIEAVQPGPSFLCSALQALGCLKSQQKWSFCHRILRLLELVDHTVFLLSL